MEKSMIINYYRPDNLPEALDLLSNAKEKAVPLGGGTFLNQPSTEPISVVDLQALDLNEISKKGNRILVGATVTLQQLLDSEFAYPYRTCIHHEATYNIRQVATIAGSIISSDGRSPLLTSLLAINVELEALPNIERISLGEYLPLRGKRLQNHLIVRISIPNNVKFAYQYVARTPADLPIVCAAVAQWPSGRTRIALGGFGDVPVLAMDGPENKGAETAAQTAYREAADKWASAEYRSNVAGILAKRCVQAISESK
jgi:probable selenate reductase FAD-binding subunit